MEEFVDSDKIEEQIAKEKEAKNKEKKDSITDFSSCKIDLKKVNTLFKLDFIAYCHGSNNLCITLDFDTFVKRMKMQLCIEKHILTKDPIWDKYTIEEIYLEWKAMLFSKNASNEVEDFESVLKSGSRDTLDFADWADTMIGSNEKELKKKSEEMEDNISFNPQEI